MSDRPDAPRDLLDSDANVGAKDGLAGGMGVSSERVGKVRGSTEPATHGTEATGVAAEEIDPAGLDDDAGLNHDETGHN